MYLLALQVAVKATAGERRKRRGRSVHPLFSTFTGGGAWNHAPPLVTNRVRGKGLPLLFSPLADGDSNGDLKI